MLIVEKFELSLQLGQEARDIYIKLGFPLEAQGLAEEIYIQEASIQLGDINEKIYNCNEMQSQEKKHSSVICTPQKLDTFGGANFLWAKQEEKTKRTRQNSKSML